MKLNQPQSHKKTKNKSRRQKPHEQAEHKSYIQTYSRLRRGELLISLDSQHSGTSFLQPVVRNRGVAIK